MPSPRTASSALLWLAPLLLAPTALAQAGARDLPEIVGRLTAPLVQDQEQMGLRIRADVTATIDPTDPRVEKARAAGPAKAVEVVLDRTGPKDFALRITSPWATASFARSAERTVLALPERGVAFVGEGALPEGAETLQPEGFVARLLSGRTQWAGVARAFALQTARGLVPAGPGRWQIDESTTLMLHATAKDTLVALSDREGGFAEGFKRLELGVAEQPYGVEVTTDGLRIEKVARAELERMVLRALRRALSIRLPEAFGIVAPRPRKVPHGELRRVDGQTLAILHGTPEEIGKAHGELLGEHARHTMDSTLHLVGLVETVRSGKWFPSVLDGAWQRLRPHVPERHVRELYAMADAAGVDRREAVLGNMFPEYFHCSGFAVFGKATAGGKLYHGRVLDYMTLVGLQQAAVTFVVKAAGQHAWIAPSYAGFNGIVTGMNDQQISLGEMGGGGTGLWDGVPMATLMRRAVEECGTLDAVRKLWKDSPRTCEYYYVFADGKIPSAVGVKAVPDRVEFVAPGQAHPLLGPGIEDAVVLSAGKRLELLRQRVEQQHGKIDEQAAIRLMDRPVAMQSNLHNALFVPQDGVLWVANASQDRPAAEERYVRYDLRALLRELDAAEASGPGAAPAGAAKEVPEAAFAAKDTLDLTPDPSKDAQEMLARLRWKPAKFTVRTHHEPGEWDAIVTFPTPKPTGSRQNDEVVLEWYAARDREHRLVEAPAVLVHDILDGSFRVARSVARYMSRADVHAFVIHQPYYGRRGTKQERHDPTKIMARFEQAASDARRARDAIAALPWIEPGRISIQGTSLGGFVSTIAASLDHGFEQAFVLMAGGHLYSMLMEGGQDSAKIREEIRKAGYKDEQVRQVTYAVDPIRLAHRLDPRRTYLYSCVFDQVVPAKNAKALGEAAKLDAEHHFWYPAGHYTAIAFVPLVLPHMLGRIRAGAE